VASQTVPCITFFLHRTRSMLLCQQLYTLTGTLSMDFKNAVSWRINRLTRLHAGGHVRLKRCAVGAQVYAPKHLVQNSTSVS
jgi:hypothetical protein